MSLMDRYSGPSDGRQFDTSLRSLIRDHSEDPETAGYSSDF